MSEDSSQPATSDLTEFVRRARRGLRSDVAALVEALEDAELCVPLREHVPGVPAGEQLELSTELALAPHMLLDPEGHLCCVAFTRGELIDDLAEQLGWTTSGDLLEYCTLPARGVLDMALQVIDDREVVGIVLNPGSDSELFLQRHELASIMNRSALPLVGYVDRIQESSDQGTLLAEPAEPPPPELLAALEGALAALPQIASYTLQHTFNPERDLEPHLTLRLRSASPPADQSAVASTIVEAIAEKLPPPGYIDILFETRS